MMASQNATHLKGSLFLRSNHMKYNRGTLNSKWNDDRESEPKDYDIFKCETKDWNLLKATYNRIGDLTDGSLKDAKTTQQEAMAQVGELKDDYETKEYPSMIVQDNFSKACAPRDTGKPERGYGSVLPRHELDHDKMHLKTTYWKAYQYPYYWTPIERQKPSEPEVRFHRGLSEFTNPQGYKQFGINTFQDSVGSCHD